MNRERARELLPIIQAFAEGKTIEQHDGYISWNMATNPDFSCHPSWYRIKPEPEVIYFNKKVTDNYSYGYDSKERAELDAVSKDGYEYIAKEFAEVIK